MPFKNRFNRLHKYNLTENNRRAAITQLVECLAVNQDVTGSSPVGGVLNVQFSGACSLVRLERPAHNRAVTGSNPVRPIIQIPSPDAGRSNNFCQKRKNISGKIYPRINTQDFEKFLRLQKSLSERTVENHIINTNVFLRSDLSIEDFLLDIKNTRSVSTYRDYLCTFKVLFRDYLKQPRLVEDFKFPKKQCKPKILPSKKQLKAFYKALPDKYKVTFWTAPQKVDR